MFSDNVMDVWYNENKYGAIMFGEFSQGIKTEDCLRDCDSQIVLSARYRK